MLEKIRRFETIGDRKQLLSEGNLIFDTFLDENSVFQVKVSINITRGIKEVLTTKERETEMNYLRKNSTGITRSFSFVKKTFQNAKRI